MKKINKKSLLLLILVAAILMVSVGGTVAYLATSTGSLVNTFTPGNLGTEIEETFDNTKKSNVKVTNIGDVTVYVRAVVVANWCDESGKIVAPWTDNISYNETDWDEGIDGYWYHKTSVEANKSTGVLFTEYTYSADEIPDGADHLEMTVIHQSVQAEPTTAVANLWGVTVAADGTISK